MWFRRDLRVRDNPALLAAGSEVLPVFVFDPVLWDASSSVRKAYLVESLRSLNESLGGHLIMRSGDPSTVIPALVKEVNADSVHIAADFGPYGQQRDLKVEAALSALSVPLVRTGSPYAVAPGRVVKSDDTPYRVFTPFYKAWTTHGWRAAATGPRSTFELPTFVSAPSEALPAVTSPVPLPAAGEGAVGRRPRHPRAPQAPRRRHRGRPGRPARRAKQGGFGRFR